MSYILTSKSLSPKSLFAIIGKIRIITYSRRDGFTLVELSIVLVIIGLLIGGILAAQSMIQTAKIQAQVRQLQQFDVTITNFHTKFNQIPGDCNICGHDNAGGYDTRSGDGKLEDFLGNVPPTASFVEILRFFPDLHTMGNITDDYEPNLSGSVVSTVSYGLGYQFPNAAIGRGGLMVTGNNFGDIYYTFIDAPVIGNNSFFSAAEASGNFSSAEALALDTKLDDGNPTTGNVAATTATAAASTSTLPFTAAADNSGSCVYNGAYNVSLSATNLCRIVIKSNFQ